MTPRRRSVRLALEPLDRRVLPANLTVTFAAGTLTVVGDGANNDVTVEADPADATHFSLTSSGTINGQPSPYFSPSGVKNFAFKMGAGDDLVTFDNARGPTTVEGSVSIDGGDGANQISATDLTVTKNLAVTNGTASAGIIQTALTNLSVGGNVTIKSTGGNTSTTIQRNAAGVSTIKGSLTVTNGTGRDAFVLNDTNVDKNVTINNGHGDSGGSAGYTIIYNLFNADFRSVIGGNFTVTYLDGNTSADDAFLDTEVLGNATFNHGPGSFITFFDGYVTQLPELIRGNLSILGTGANSVYIASYNHTGLVVGKKFTLASGGGSAETLAFKKLQVGGNTALTLGDGGNTVIIDDSEFDGTFTLLSGAGADTVNLETTAGTTAATEFYKAVLIDLGAGSDTINEVYTGSNTPDAGEALLIWSKFSVLNVELANSDAAAVFFPNGQ